MKQASQAVLTISLLISAIGAFMPFVAPAANAQTGGGFLNQQPIATVMGNYTNTDAKLQIMLPDKWTGSVFENRNGTLTTIRVVPNGTLQSGQGFRVPDSIVIRIVTTNTTPGSNNTSSPFTMTGQSGQNRNFQNGSNNTSSPFTMTGQSGQNRNFQNRSNVTCTPSAPQPVTINGMSGTMYGGDCTSPSFTFKYKSYAFQTLNKAFQISLMSTTSADFDKYTPVFDKSVNTLQIADTIQAPTIAPEFPVAIVGIMFAIAIASISLTLRTRFSGFGSGTRRSD